MNELSWQERFFKLLYKVLKGILIIWGIMAILVVLGLFSSLFMIM